LRKIFQVTGELELDLSYVLGLLWNQEIFSLNLLIKKIYFLIEQSALLI